jgi:hypothetical protein
MRSDKQNEASKNNGKKSKGPVTPEGKEKSSRNAVFHNLTSGRLALLPNEDPREFREFHDHYVHRFQPVDNVELDLTEKMIAASWRERRILAMESALFEIEMDRQSEAVEQEWEEITPAARQVLVLFGTTGATATANLLLRYKAAARREYASALRLLRDLQGPRFNRFRGPIPVLDSAVGGASDAPEEIEGMHAPDRPQQDGDSQSEIRADATSGLPSQPRYIAEFSVIGSNRGRAVEVVKNKKHSPDINFDIADLQNEPKQMPGLRNPHVFLHAKAAA